MRDSWWLAAICCSVSLGQFAPPPARPVVPVDILINGTEETTDDYVTWAPMRCKIRVRSDTNITGELKVSLSSPTVLGKGEVVFGEAVPPPGVSAATEETLELSLPANSDWREFVIAGKYGHASTSGKDALIEVGPQPEFDLLLVPVMVRVRKNANTLTAQERDRFLTALMTLYTRGDFGVYQTIHTATDLNGASPTSQAHGVPAFLPWHRAFILRLERDLQEIDPTVTLPYWDFDEPAPNVFHLDFLGVPPLGGSWYLNFSSGNPIALWQIVRAPGFQPSSNPFLNDDDSLLGSTASYHEFYAALNFNPHGNAHVQSGGWLAQLAYAAADPLFFLLHANVDRLWARWQLDNDRFDTGIWSYWPGGSSPPGNGWAGSYLNDTMWPWNNVMGWPRPSSAPEHPFPTSDLHPAPPATPRPANLLDYVGRVSGENYLGYCYDDTPYN